MAFLGSPVDDQSGETPFAPRCIKDLVEEKLFSIRKELDMRMEVTGESIEWLQVKQDLKRLH